MTQRSQFEKFRISKFQELALKMNLPERGPLLEHFFKKWKSLKSFFKKNFNFQKMKLFLKKTFSNFYTF